MTRINRAVFAVASFSFLVSLAVPLHAAPTYKIHWFLGHKNLDYFEEAALDFKKTVEKASNGDIAVEVVMQANDDPSQNPSHSSEIADKVAKGEAEMGHSFVDVMGSVDPKLHAFEAPYLFRGYRHMEGVFEGPLGSELLAGMRAHGVVGLSFTYSGGASAVATTERALQRPEDLKGLKVGVYGDEVNRAWLTTLGAVPVAIEHRLEDIAPLARDGKLDAVVTTWRNFQRIKLNSEFKYMSLADSTYLVSVTYINPKFYDSLPEKYRALITTASREAGRIERAKTIELNENCKLDMVGRGIRVVNLTEANRARLVKALRPAYADAIERVVGKDLIERIRTTADAPEHPAVVHSDFAQR